MGSYHLGSGWLDTGEESGVGGSREEARSRGLLASHLHQYGDAHARRHAAGAAITSCCVVIYRNPRAQHAKNIGIGRILALRGDEPRGEEYFVAVDSQFQHAVDLVRYIRRQHGATFSLGVAGYPEVHDRQFSLDQEIKHLKEKVDAGADFVVTQLFYDVEGFLTYYRSCRAAGARSPFHFLAFTTKRGAQASPYRFYRASCRSRITSPSAV